MYPMSTAVAQDRAVPQNLDSVSLTIMCLDAAVKNLQEAGSFHANGAADAAHEKVRKVQDIVTELLVGLDYEQGGAIAINLGKIYNFVIRTLISVTPGQDPEVYDRLASILSDLRDTWEQLRSTGGIA